MRNLSLQNSLIAFFSITGALAAGIACSDDEGGAKSSGQGSGGASGSDGGSGGAGAGGTGTGGAGTGGKAAGDAGDCSVTLSPGGNATEALQGALIEAKSGDVICLGAGTYAFTKEITLTGTNGVTVRGVGATRDEVILDILSCWRFSLMSADNAVVFLT
jgi:hypothetical protein